MIYVFEDHPNDISSIFFKSAYSSEMVSKFVYTEGNQNIYDIAVELLNATTEQIVIFLDTIPGNQEIVRIYRDIRELVMRHAERIILVPIVCSEYYMIKSLVNTQVLIDRRGVDLCLELQPHFNSEIIETAADKKFCKNFEKYCKLIMIKCFMACAKHSACANNRYGKYYTTDCKCESHDDGCCDESQQDKVIRLLQQYPCIPSCSLVSNFNKYTFEQFKVVHRKMIEDYNRMVDRFRAADKSGRRYRYLPPAY